MHEKRRLLLLKAGIKNKKNQLALNIVFGRVSYLHGSAFLLLPPKNVLGTISIIHNSFIYDPLHLMISKVLCCSQTAQNLADMFCTS